MKWFVAGVSAVALAAGGALAQGNGNARGNDGGTEQAGTTRAERGIGGANRSAQSATMQPDRGKGGGNAKAADDRGNRPVAGNNSGNNRNANTNSSSRAEINDRGGPPLVRGNGNANGNANRAVRPDVAGDRRGPVRIVSSGGPRGLIAGCPPGLAKKYNGCRPPGQAMKEDSYFSRYGSDWWGLPRIGSGRYRYESGYLIRLLADGRVGSYLPLLGGALSIGNNWPGAYGYDPLPPYYASYYGLGQPDYYRYSDRVVYRVDPETAAITSIAALLTGDEFAIGQPMPARYDVYNVPRGYRDRYYDRPDAWYRYSDGYVYQIDPETRLVAAAIELLVS